MERTQFAAGTLPPLIALGPEDEDADGPDDEPSDVEKIFQHLFSQSNLFSTIPHNLWTPPTDVYETPNTYVIRIEIPGLASKEDVKIELHHNVVTVRGYRRDRSIDVKLGFHQMEIHYGYFEKVVTLPHSIDPEIEPASYEDGFLCIRIGKAEPPKKTRRRIQIG